MVFWSTFILMHSFGEKNLKNHFFGKKSFLSAIFSAVLVQMVTNRPTRLKNTLTIEISFESDFLRFFEKVHFTRNLKIIIMYVLKINACALIYLGLVGHNLQSLLSPFRNRKFSPMSHTSSFGVKNKRVN